MGRSTRCRCSMHVKAKWCWEEGNSEEGKARRRGRSLGWTGRCLGLEGRLCIFGARHLSLEMARPRKAARGKPLPRGGTGVQRAGPGGSNPRPHPYPGSGARIPLAPPSAAALPPPPVERAPGPCLSPRHAVLSQRDRSSLEPDWPLAPDAEPPLDGDSPRVGRGSQRPVR